MQKLPQKKNGLGNATWCSFKGYVSQALGLESKKRVSPARMDEKRFEHDAREQFIQLKNKGLSIPVFTL
jgi:hypothetical protein